MSTPGKAGCFDGANILDARSIRHMPIWTRNIVCDVANSHGVPIREIMGRTRVAAVVKARHEAIYLVKLEKPALSTTILAKWFDRDPKTIIHAIAKYQDESGGAILTHYKLRTSGQSRQRREAA